MLDLLVLMPGCMEHQILLPVPDENATACTPAQVHHHCNLQWSMADCAGAAVAADPAAAAVDPVRGCHEAIRQMLQLCKQQPGHGLLAGSPVSVMPVGSHGGAMKAGRPDGALLAGSPAGAMPAGSPAGALRAGNPGGVSRTASGGRPCWSWSATSWPPRFPPQSACTASGPRPTGWAPATAILISI